MVAAVWLLFRRERPPSPRDMVAFLLCGLFGIALYNGLLNSGQKSVSAGAAAFLINTGPVITALLATIFLRERFGRIAWIGSILSFAGVGIIAAGQPGGFRLGAGASLVLCAAACQAGYFILQRPLVPRYGALRCTAYTIIAGALLLFPWLPTAAVHLATSDAANPSFQAVVALAILPSVIGYAAWTYALGSFGAARAANFLYLVPPVSLVIAFFLTNETPAVATLVGGSIAILGVALVNLRSMLDRPRHSEARLPMAGGSPIGRRSSILPERRVIHGPPPPNL